MLRKGKGWKSEGHEMVSKRCIPKAMNFKNYEIIQTIFYKYRQYKLTIILFKNIHWGFPGGAVVENLPANAGDTGSSPGLGRSHMPRSN